jgi:hypothetical protein
MTYLRHELTNSADISIGKTSPGMHKGTRFLTDILFFALLAALIAVQVMIFFRINLGPIDSDQPFMWIGAHDYAQGRFYEPRFYGQDYNTFMEALFAVPFMWMSIPVYMSVPIATHLIFLTPWVFTAFWLFLRNRKAAAILMLFVPLCMPVEYDIVNGIPRGWVTGLFFCSFFVTSLYNPRLMRLVALNTVCAIIGYFVNPNSVVVSAPVMLFIFLHNYRRISYYVTTAWCLVSVIPFYLIFDLFYQRHPDYVVYGLFYSLTPSHFLHNLAALPAAFVHITPFLTGQWWIPIVAACVLGVALYFFHRKTFFAFLGLWFVVLLSCLSDKTTDGSWWPFYSYSRMFLGIPFVLALFGGMLPGWRRGFLRQRPAGRRPARRIRAEWIIAGVLVIYLPLKFFFFEKRVAHNLQDKLWIGVHLVPLKDVLNAVPYYGNKCREYGVEDLCISNPFWLSSYIAYGGPAIYPDYPRTQESNSERRYRVREEGKTRYRKGLIYISSKSDIDKWIRTKNFEMVRLDDYGLFYIKNNRLSIHDFLKEVKTAEDRMR